MGISSHSEANKHYVIFSVYQGLDLKHAIGRKSSDNESAHSEMKRHLETFDIKYVELEGCYKGTKEKSFLVPMDKFSAAWAFKNGQECYLEIFNHKHGMYKAYFVYVDGKKDFVGYLRQFNKTDIDNLKLDYSYRPDTKEYFVIWNTDTCTADDFQREINEKLKNVA